jgi:two-component sensor histidine kinase
MDYLYKPQHYASFLNSYSDYIIREVHQGVLTGFVHYSNNLLAEYYLKKGAFAGYPKYLLLSETLLKLAESATQSSYQNELHDFITACKDPDLLQKFTEEHDLSIKLQPGKNIRDLHLSIEEDLSLKKSADGYILIDMSRNFDETGAAIYKEAELKIIDGLEAVGVKTKIQMIQPERYYFNTHRDTTYSVVYEFNEESKDLLRDRQILRNRSNSLLLIRNDGTIVARNIYGHWRSSRVEGKTKWTFQTESVIPFIKDDMKRNKQAGFDFSILFIIFISVLFSCGAAYFMYKARVKAIRKKEENKRLISELELKAIRSQMNPHFIFNALSSIQHFMNQGKNSEANQYLLNFAKLLRMVLATSEKKLTPLSDEIEQLELYLQLEQLRVPFDYRIEIDSTIQPNYEEIPGMLIQPIVENAVKHGIGANQGGTITIRFSKVDQVLLAEITDDGAGFVSSSQPMNGFGLKATEERLRLINEDFKTNIGIRMERNDPTGAKVVISIPV